jgi:hypothetical protein
VPMGGEIAARPGRRTYSVTVDLDLGPGASGMGFSVQLLRPGAVVPQVTEVAHVTAGDAPTSFDIEVDPRDGDWAVLRVSDPAGDVDRRAPAPYRHLGASVAYTSPWWFDGS